ncbi:putative 4-mercaptohistidine N1-methyltransferase [Ruficoccus amylovorans]|uniref:Putative 4-mercaptohistidine N1-methyltransferase n=1 Tax=Ruficoccus amylovorans TaxID=1804625 RepID=A0A842HHT7_9BACT|nr:putative 4-mercaptohistidine N1-methyltransferase [Ruficoccus amylovorans]MBC2595107.1 putative 4-mercaptohistidine N1-methyltransferase [Ruficoccus amylovorans]
MNPYEADKQLNLYLLFHYGTAKETLPYSFGPREALNFPARCVSELVDTARLGPDRRALEVGCSVGRTSFELARHCGEVIGMDSSENFIGAANELAQKGLLDYTRTHEGHIHLRSVAAVPEDIDRSRVSFRTGDALALPDSLGSFDLVIACNLICRLPRPLDFLKRLPSLVNPGGQLVLTTPFTWLEEYTPPENWLGGTAKAEDSFNGLRGALEPAFALEMEKDMPFLIKETARKYQWTVAQASRWVRTSH